MSNSFSQLQTLQLLLSNKLAPLPEKENASSSSRPTPADVRQTFRHIYRSGEGDITLLYIQLQAICSDLFAGSCTSATMGMASCFCNECSIHPFYRAPTSTNRTRVPTTKALSIIHHYSPSPTTDYKIF
nr:hypothetical protein Iba_chr12eCG12570 [Ipomoea batatas]